MNGKTLKWAYVSIAKLVNNEEVIVSVDGLNYEFNNPAYYAYFKAVRKPDKISKEMLKDIIAEFNTSKALKVRRDAVVYDYRITIEWRE